MTRSAAEADGEQAVLGAARRAVALAAPEELPLFQVTADEFRRAPRRVLSGRKHTDRMLESGLGVVVPLVAPAAMSVATVVYQQLVADATDNVLARGKVGLRRLRRRLGRGKSAGLGARTPVDTAAAAAAAPDPSQATLEVAAEPVPMAAPNVASDGSGGGSRLEMRHSPTELSEPSPHLVSSKSAKVSEELLERLQDLATRRGVQAGLPEDTARLVAVEVVAALAQWQRPDEV